MRKKLMPLTGEVYITFESDLDETGSRIEEKGSYYKVFHVGT
jgi:hypothetical protein